jgi:hypothetical protein
VGLRYVHESALPLSAVRARGFEGGRGEKGG